MNGHTHKLFQNILNPKSANRIKSRLLFLSAKMLRSLYGKTCGPRSDHAVCLYTEFVSNVSQLFAANDFSRQHFQMHFFLGALRVNDDVQHEGKGEINMT